MKQISKKDLINLITESANDLNEESLLDEMAVDVKGEINPWDNPNFNTNEDKNTQAKARWFIRQYHKDYKEYDPVDVWIYNIKPKGEGTGRGVDINGNPKNYKFVILAHESIPTISADPKEQSQFVDRFTNWVKLMEKNGYVFVKNPRFKVKDDPLRIGKADDDPKQLKNAYALRDSLGMKLALKSAISNSVAENINLKLMSDIRKVMDDSDFRQHLLLNGIPEIYTPKNIITKDSTIQKHGTDTYGSRTNEKIVWSSNRILNPFSSVDEYAEYVNGLMVKQGMARETKHLQRQYPSGPKKGSFQYNAEIIVENRFSVHGEINGDNGFVWNLHFKASVGKKNDVGLVKYAEAKSVTLSDDATPGKDGTVLSNMEVVGALRQALEDIKSQLMQVSVEQLYNKSIQAVDGFDLATSGEQPNDEPELEPQADVAATTGAEKPKKGKKITKEAIESMIKNMLHEAINK